MRRFLALMLAATLLCGAGVAEGASYADMSDEELHGIIDAARNELARRERALTKDMALFEAEGFTLYLTGKNALDDQVLDSQYLHIGALAVNDGEKDIGVAVNSAVVNGWEVYCSGLSVTSEGKKREEDLLFDVASTGIQSLDEVEDIQLSLSLYDAESYMLICDLEPLSLQVN